MGNDHTGKEIIAWDFLKHPDAETQFAKVDYALKNGIHIQNKNRQGEMFRFIQDNEQSFQKYYKEYFGICLEAGGESTEKYYYIDFMPQSRGNIPSENRHFLPNEYVVIGFLIYKIIFIDGYIDLNSVKRLQKMIRQDYEELKLGIYRALAKTKREKNTKYDDDKLDKLVSEALLEFGKIGWVTIDEDTFDTLPSFHRLNKIYGDYINNLDEWLNENKEA